MQGPNRLGLGLRPNYQGQGPPIGSLPPSNAQYGGGYGPPRNTAQKMTTLFVGSISAGVTDEFLQSLLSACGPVQSWKRLTNPNGKPQGFGFVDFEEPDATARAVRLLHGKTIPALEPGSATKSLVVRADEKTKAFLQAYEAQRIKTDQDDAAEKTAETLISSLLEQSNASAAATIGDSGGANSQNIVPPHLRDLSEADLPENQRGLVISEIALFRERAAKREQSATDADRMGSRSAGVGGFSGIGGMGGVPSGPKERVWGRPKDSPAKSQTTPQRQGSWGSDPQSHSKPPGFVKGESAIESRDIDKTDEELERERKIARRKEEDESFRDRERRYETREDSRIYALERVIARVRQAEENQQRDSIEMRERLHVWDDDESDELFYVDRARWRSQRVRHVAAERAADEKSRAIEARQAEHLRVESETFLARQMAEMQSLAEEQRKAGLLMEDGAPVRLSISTAAANSGAGAAADAGKAVAPAISKPPAGVFGVEDDDDGTQKRKAPLVKIDFGGVEAAGRQERLEKVKASVKKDKEWLFKSKIRWDGINDNLIEGKLEHLTKRKMTEYLGQLDDDDLVMFVIEHLKDHKPAAKLIEGLEPVLEEEAEEFTISLWRQVVFESLAYSEGLETDDVLVD